MIPPDTPLPARGRRTWGGSPPTPAEEASAKFFRWFGVSDNGAPARLPAGGTVLHGALLFGCAACQRVVGGVDAHLVDDAEPVYVAEMRWNEVGEGRQVPLVLDPDDLPLLRTDCPVCGELQPAVARDVLVRAREVVAAAGDRRRSRRVARVYMHPHTVDKR